MTRALAGVRHPPRRQSSDFNSRLNRCFSVCDWGPADLVWGLRKGAAITARIEGAHRPRKAADLNQHAYNLYSVLRPAQVNVHLIDGTWELFRHYYALPSARDPDGREVAAVRGVIASVLELIRQGATHTGVATDHVIESFRNALWPGYKTGEGIEPDLFAQFPLLEEALSAMGVAVWPMIEFEADDALASAAAIAARDPRVDRVLICTPDKDLAQCVRGTRVVQFDRLRRILRDERGILAKFGVLPCSIPDYLALVGDSADGYPGLPGWGAKSTAAVLHRYGRIEDIPNDWRTWNVNAANAGALAATLARERDRAYLFRTLATLREDIPLFDSVDQLEWRGPTPAFEAIGARLNAAVTEETAKRSRANASAG